MADPKKVPSGVSDWEDVPMAAAVPHTSSSEWEDVAHPADAPGAVSRLFSGLGDTLLPSKTLGDYVEGPANLLLAPFSADARQKLGAGFSEMGTQMLNAHKGQFNKAADEFNTAIELAKHGNVKDSMMSSFLTGSHALAGLTPLVGPAAANAGENVGNGNVAEGLGQSTGLLAPFGVSKLRSVALANKVDPAALMTQAVKPGRGANALKFQANAQTALPALQEAAQAMGTDFASIDNLSNLLPKAKQMFWQKYQNLLSGNGGATADASAVADAMESQITPRFERLNPKAAANIRKQADYYRQNPMTLDQLESELQGANNDLNTYYAKNKVKQATAMNDPDVGHTVAEAEALRQVLYNKLNSLTGADAASIKRTYGALKGLEEPVLNRQGYIAQQAPFDLGDRFNLSGAVGDLFAGRPLKAIGRIAANRVMNEANRTNNMLQRAYTLTGAPVAPPIANPALMAPLTLQATHTYDPQTGELIEH